MKFQLSRDCILFFMVETRNLDGVQPATLGSAYDSYLRAPASALLSWCGYKKNYPGANSNSVSSETKRFIEELGIELRRLIRKHGKKIELEILIGR